MALETGTYVNDLVITNPTPADPKSQGDDHLRLIKAVLHNTFPGYSGAVIVSGTSGGAADAYTLTPSTALAGYTANTAFLFSPAAANATTTPTLNVSGLGAITMVDASGNALSPGDFAASGIYIGVYDGTHIRVVSITKTAPTQPAGDSSTKIATTAFVQSAAFNSALPYQSGNAGKIVTTNGTTASWEGGANGQIPIGNGSGFTIANLSAGTGMAITNNAGAVTISTTIPRGYINGFTLSNDGTTPNTVLDIAAGYAADSANAVIITGTAFTKTTGGTFVAGTSNAGMGAGLTVAASTWYHVFAIIYSGSYDVYFDTSTTAANAPAGTTAHRYIGSFLTDGSSNIRPFLQIGQKFVWQIDPGIMEFNGTAPTSQTALTISTPLGLQTDAIIHFTFTPASITFMTIYRANSAYREGAYYAPVANQTVTYELNVITNTSSQIGWSAGAASTNAQFFTNGYINPHVAPVF
jgi:hypothetical protein